LATLTITSTEVSSKEIFKIIWRNKKHLYICRVNSQIIEQMKLTNTEEQLMELIWERGPIYMKDIIDSYPEPKPATTTLATLLKRMQNKGFVAYKLMGNSREYYALVKKSAYFSKHVNGLIKNFFGSSPMQFASFFTKETNLSDKELEDLKKIIDNELKRKKS
jgi:BlaI family penicillinase repressor